MRVHISHKWLPAILTAISAVGTIATGYFAAKAGYKSVNKIEEAVKDKGEDLTASEKVKAVGAMYIPAIVCGAITIASGFGGYAVGRKINLGLGAAYLAARKRSEEYEEAVKEEYGEEGHAKILTRLAMPDVERAQDMNLRSECLGTVCKLDWNAPDEERTFLDAWSGKYFISTINRVMNAEACLNRNFVLCGHVPIEQWYDFLGIQHPEKCKEADYCWDIEDELCWIDFNHYRLTTDDGFEAYVIEFACAPYPDPGYTYM